MMLEFDFGLVLDSEPGSAVSIICGERTCDQITYFHKTWSCCEQN
jgi:hypothetical protein